MFGGAFKGANGIDQTFMDIRRYLANLQSYHKLQRRFSNVSGGRVDEVDAEVGAGDFEKVFDLGNACLYSLSTSTIDSFNFPSPFRSWATAWTRWC